MTTNEGIIEVQMFTLCDLQVVVELMRNNETISIGRMRGCGKTNDLDLKDFAVQGHVREFGQVDSIDINDGHAIIHLK